jgi:hypothetical protein
MKIRFLLVLMLIPVGLNAQTPPLNWRANIGGSLSDQGNYVTTDVGNNVYTTGFFQGTVDFDPGPSIYNLTSGGLYDVFLTKYDPCGNFIWAKRIGADFDDVGHTMVTDLNKNIYFAISFNDTTDVDPGVGVTNFVGGTNADMAIIKLDSSGNFVWAKQFQSNLIIRPDRIELDGSGNILVAGIMSGTVDFDPGAGVFNLTSAGLEDIFLLKLNTSGDWVWAKRMGAASSDYGTSLSVAGNGSIYLTGFFASVVDFDPNVGTFNLSSAGNTDIFIAKYSSAGNLSWAKKMGNASSDRAYEIDMDAQGYLYVTGYFGATVDFDPGAGTTNLVSAGGDDIFVTKFDTSGNFVWAGKIGGTSNDRALSLASDQSGNAYISGQFNGTVDIDPGPAVFNLTSVVGSDVFVAQLNPTGALIWGGQFVGTNLLLVNSVALDGSGSVYYSGEFQDTVDIDPGPAATYMHGSGFSDAYVVKIGLNAVPAQPSAVTGNLVVCAGSSQSYAVINDPLTTSYSWTLPGGWSGTSTTNTINAIAATSGTISVVANGVCGSSIPQTLNVAVNPNTTSTQNITSCVSYTWPVNGNNYAFSGTYHATISNHLGCDSLITLNLTIHNSSSSSQSATACTSYTWPVDGNTYTSSGMYNATIPNMVDCDSVITLNLTINNNSSSSQSATACTSYTWPADGNIYTSSGIYNTTIPNQAGCDSVITLNLTINNNTSSSQSAMGCTSYLWSVNGNTYTSSGVYNATMPNHAGCDSVITLNLTIHPSTASTINASDCEMYTSPSGNYTFTSSGTYLDTIPNSDGCDSIITIHLTIHGLPTVSYNESTTLACVNWSAFTLSSAIPAGGTYSGAGVTVNNFNPSSAGLGNHLIIYQYTDVNNCTNSDTSFIQINSCLNLDEVNNHPVNLFPNPNQGIFTIESPFDDASIKLYDMHGKLILEQSLIAGENKFDLNLSSGVYHVYVQVDEIPDKILKLVVW